MPQQARRHLRPDRHGRPGHDRPARAARRGAVAADPGEAQGDRRDADRDPRPRPGRGDHPARQARGSAKYVILRHGLDRVVADQIRAAIADKSASALSLEPEPERVYPQAGGGPGSSLAAHLLGFVNREGGGQYGVEQAYQSTLAGQPRVVVADRDASGQARMDAATVTEQGEPGADLTPDHRCRSPAPGRAGAPGGLGRGQGEARLGRGHGSLHRRDLRRGDLSVVRRQRLQGDRRQRSVALHRSGRGQRLRAGLRVQDDDRGGRADQGHGHPDDEDQGRRDAPPGQGQDQDRRRRPQGHGLDDVRGRHRLFAQRRRGEGRARPRDEHPGIVRDPL